MFVRKKFKKLESKSNQMIINLCEPEEEIKDLKVLNSNESNTFFLNFYKILKAKFKNLESKSKPIFINLCETEEEIKDFKVLNSNESNTFFKIFIKF